MIEDLPEDFVERPDEFGRLVGLLLDGAREETVAITAALRGAGGYGKTTLARALCHDERVQDAFDDGILWVTLGETPGELTGRVEDLIYMLSDERPGFAGIDAATARLVELLEDRDVLIVIDDVWNGAHLRPFMQGGPRCARLITTRNFDTLPPDAKKVDVDAMRRGEAVALLGAGLLSEGSAALAALAARLGEWPLLLKLVNGTLRDRVAGSGQPLADALIYVNKALDRRGLTFFDARNPALRAQAVGMTLGISLEQLDEGERARYGELAVFPEDADVPLKTVGKLWGATGGLDEFDTESLCERLSRLSLLLGFDLATSHIRLHDVVRGYLMHGQGANLPLLHRRLLDTHRPAADSQNLPTRWAGMPAGEPYLWDHLAYHLVEAERGTELVETVKDLLYLITKTYLRGASNVEADLLTAELVARTDDELRLLRRTYVQSGHILNRCDQARDLAATLVSRLQHLSVLGHIIRRFLGAFTPPYLTALQPLPDLPDPSLLRTLSGHTGEVTSCAISTDGSFMVSGSYDRTLKVWDINSGTELLTLTGHEGEVNGCAFSPDGSFIISVSVDMSLIVWDVSTGAVRRRFRNVTRKMPYSSWLHRCAVSPDGTYAVLIHRFGNVCLMHTIHSREIKLFDEDAILSPYTEVECCAISPDGTLLASVSGGVSTLSLWDVATQIKLKSFPAGRSGTYCCAFSRDNSFIVAAQYDKTLKVWDVATGDERMRLQGHTDIVYSCAVSPDGSFIVSTSRDRTVRIWDAKTGRNTRTMVGHQASTNDCAISHDGRLIVTASADRTIKFWDARGGEVTEVPPGHSAAARACVVSSDGTFAVSASNDMTVKVWDAASGRARLTLAGHKSLVTSCAVSPDGSFVVSASYDRTVRVWDARDGSAVSVFRGHALEVTNCAVSPDGAFVVSAARDGTLKIWSPRTGQEHFAVAAHADVINSCLFCADGSRVISASSDGTIKVWDVERRAVMREFRGGGTAPVRCALSPDESFLVSTHYRTLKVWDVNAGMELFTLDGHTNAVNGCAISRDGSLIASSSSDETLAVWNTGSGKCLAKLYTDGVLNDCAWFPDGRSLIVAGNSGVYFLRLML